MNEAPQKLEDHPDDEFIKSDGTGLDELLEDVSTDAEVFTEDRDEEEGS